MSGRSTAAESLSASDPAVTAFRIVDGALEQRGLLGVVEQGAGLLHPLHVDVAVAFLGTEYSRRVSSNDVSSRSADSSEI
jgi:hypothetical protein